MLELYEDIKIERRREIWRVRNWEPKGEVNVVCWWQVTKSLRYLSSLLFSSLSFFFCYPTQLLLNIMWYSTSFTSTTWKMIRQKMLQIIAIDSLFAEVKLHSSFVLLSQSFSRNKNVFKYFRVHWKYFFSVKQMNENRHQRLGMDKTRYDISKLPKLRFSFRKFDLLLSF